MKLSTLLEAKEGNWWITPQGRPVFLGRGGHEDYMADNGLSYASAFRKGYIRAVTSMGTADFMFAPKNVTKKARMAMRPIAGNSKEIHVDPVKMISKDKYTYDYTPKMTLDQFKERFLT